MFSPQPTCSLFMRYSCFFLLSALLIGVLFRCTTQKEKAPDNKYSVYLMKENGDECILEMNSLASGTINPDKEFIALDRTAIQRDLIVRNGFYYNHRKDYFYKLKNRNSRIEKVDSISLKNFILCNFHWVDTDTLLLIGTRRDYTQTRYVKINVNAMTAIEGVLDTPGLIAGYSTMTMGFSQIKNGKLFVGYNYSSKQESGYLSGDTSYVAVFDYPGMKRESILKDTRSVYPGGENTVEPGSFTDEQGDVYFLTCPGIALGDRPDKPTGIFRIKSKEDKLDSTYFFNISTSAIQNHAYSMYYLGKGKALIRSERKDLYSSWAEHWKVAHYEFYLIDLISQSVTKLDLPLDKGTRRQCVIVEDGLAYISLNSDTAGNVIWIYNISKNSLTKGLQITGDTDFILRIDRLSKN